MKSLRNMPTKLASLRAQLLRLQRMRAAVRWSSAACGGLTALVWLMIAMFVCDWSFDLAIGSRGVVLVIGLVVGFFAFRRLVWPFVTVHEAVQDIALIVERQQGIDSDVVAALQFEASKPRGGSSQLAEALIDRVAAFSGRLNLFRGFSYQPLPRRAIVLLVTTILALWIANVWPAHVSAFWNRLQLGDAPYPTRTTIESIVLNDQVVRRHAVTELRRVDVPSGQSVALQIQCGGQLPISGMARWSRFNGESISQSPLTASLTNQGAFAGELAHLADSLRVTFQLGDARSESIDVVMIPWPLVDIRWDVTPPPYARLSMEQNDSAGNTQQLIVLEGSTVTLHVVCANKRLKSGQLTIGQSFSHRATTRVGSAAADAKQPDAKAAVFQLVPANGGQVPSVSWTLAAGNPFETIHEELTYEIQVIDQDGLSLERPIVGQVRVKVDQRPRVVAAVVTQLVLPSAQPKVDFTVQDDFGVARIRATVEVSHEDGRRSEHEIVVKDDPSINQPVTVVRGQLPISLAAYDLAKGDEVQVTLHATDWRGDGIGHESASDAVTMRVTDINGILMQLSEEDKKTAKQLDEILRREMAIGRDQN